MRKIIFLILLPIVLAFTFISPVERNFVHAASVTSEYTETTTNKPKSSPLPTQTTTFGRSKKLRKKLF